VDGVDGLLSIGEFSARSGISPKRLRGYAAAGVLVPAAVDAASGYRFYSPAQLRAAELIDALRGAGMPLADIRELLRRPSSERLDSWARHLADDAAQRREALDLARSLLAPGATSRERKESAVKLKAASRTETGHVRRRNEDALLRSDALAAVADGMGGHPGGDVAAKLAVALLQAAFTGRSADELAAAVRAANRAIWERAQAGDGLAGMGSTVCAIGLVDDGSLAVVHVGDSRAYLSRDGELTLLTQDHSVTGELVRRGTLSEVEARAHPHRSVLTRVLGVGPDVEIDSSCHRVRAGDRLLLCTDGLFNEIPPDDLAAAMAMDDDVRAVADHLVDYTLTGDAPDNVSVVVLELVA
jgi:serine/threonine protein phosphatase PrpC